MQTRVEHRPLNPIDDRERVRQLQLIALEHRRRLLDLGRDLDIRLHYGATMSSVEILTALYFEWLRIDPDHPEWADRDRFVLSKGHGAPGLYVALGMRGFFPMDALKGFRQLHSILQGHPDRKKTPGVDCSTGSLGQGFPVACGMALGSQIDGSPYDVYALISDGECNEGSTWEAALIAANLGLDNLTVLLDWNRKSSYGDMQGRNSVEPLPDKWRAFGWAVLEADGHSFPSLTQTLTDAERITGQPTVILCHTIKGKGIPHAETHHTRSNFGLTESQYQEAITYLNQREAELRHDAS